MFETALKERDQKIIEQGIIKDRCELAKRMKELGYPTVKISKITGLNAEEIEEL